MSLADFFKKISGYDTLRLILCKKAILVEGDSDELVVQKAYKSKNNNRLPIEDQIDVIISVSYRVKPKRGTQFRIWAIGEYKKYKERTLSDVEQDYLNSIKILGKKTDKD